MSDRDPLLWLQLPPVACCCPDAYLHLSSKPHILGDLSCRTSPRCAAGHSRSIDPKWNSSFLSKLHSFLCYECRFTDPPSPQSPELKPSKASSAPPTPAPPPCVQSVGQVLFVFPSCCLWYLSPHPHCHGTFTVHRLDSCHYYVTSIPYTHASIFHHVLKI